MIEYLVEYLFSLIDYAYILFFFHKLNNERIQIRKFLISIIIMALLQSFSELIEMPRFHSTLKDLILIFIFLIVYVWKTDVKTVINALLIDSLFFFILTLCITLSNFFYVDMARALVFGSYRVMFTLFLKLCMITLLYYCVRMIKKLEMQTNKKTFITSSICLSFCGLLGAYILQLSERNQNLTFIMVSIELCMLFLLYLSISYSVIMKKKYDVFCFQQLLEVTEKNIDQIAKEHRNIQKIIHDVKNQMLEIDDLVTHNQIDQIHPFIMEWIMGFEYSCTTAVCLNIYVDSILQQKMAQYTEIQFNLKLVIPEQLPMKTTDLLSLIMIMVDRSCETLRLNGKSSYYFELTFYENELQIYEKYPICKIDSKQDVFRESQLKELIKKYDGSQKRWEKNGFAEESILLIL